MKPLMFGIAMWLAGFTIGSMIFKVIAFNEGAKAQRELDAVKPKLEKSIVQP